MKWWPSLMSEKNGLFMEIPRQDIRYPQLLISSTTDLENGKRKFTLFENIEDFYNLLESTPLKKRNFYEVILGEMKQKPHFDIDGITLEVVENLDKTVEEIVDAVETAFKIVGIEPDELRWYGSNRPDKRSLHLVLPGYYVNNNFEARKIYYFLKEHIPDHLFKFFDNMVYSSVQNFRILGCCKNNDKRYKRLLFREENEKTFTESLITRVRKNMKQFPYLDLPDLHNQIEIENVAMDDEIVSDAVQKVLDYLGRDSFRLYTIRNSFMSFERLKTTHCSICQVHHDSIYPFARVSPHGKVYLYCHRSREHCKNDQKHRIEIHDFQLSSGWLGDLDFFEEKKPDLNKSFSIDYSDDILEQSRKLNYKIEENNRLLKKKIKENK